jgi:hypothetical protein
MRHIEFEKMLGEVQIYTPRRNDERLSDLTVHGDLNAEERDLIADAYAEIWRSLPNLPFEGTSSRDGGSALRYEDRDGNYIWVPPKAYEAFNSYFKRDQRPYFMVMIDNSVAYGYGDRIEVWDVDAKPGMTLADMVKRASTYNIENLAVKKAELEKKRQEEERKRRAEERKKVEAELKRLAEGKSGRSRKKSVKKS